MRDKIEFVSQVSPTNTMFILPALQKGGLGIGPGLCSSSNMPPRIKVGL